MCVYGRSMGGEGRWKIPRRISYRGYEQESHGRTTWTDECTELGIQKDHTDLSSQFGSGGSWEKSFLLHIIRGPEFDPRQPYADQAEGALIVDAKALYDAILKNSMASIQSKVTDTRTAIELGIIKQDLEHICAKLRWVSSERQIADGLTKIQARQLLAERLHRAIMRLTTDVDQTASKKKTVAERKSARDFET